MAYSTLLSVSANSCKVDDGMITVTYMNSDTNIKYLQSVLYPDDFKQLLGKWGSKRFVPPTQMSNLPELKAEYISQLSDECHRAIVAGFDVEDTEGNIDHYSLKTEDQLMIQALMLKVKSGQTDNLPYHPDGKSCRFYTPEEITTLNAKMEAIIMYNTTYFNSLRDYINSLVEPNFMYSIKYGHPVPEEYQTEVLKSLIAAQSNN